MIEGVFAHAGLADTHQDVFRNIVSLRESEHLFDDLSDDPAAWQTAVQIELESKPKTFVSTTPVIDRPFEEAHWNEAVGYPFRNWMRSRYSDGTFGIWYGADTVETTVFETVHHWRAGLLGDAGFTQSGIKLERRLYRVRADAALIDLRTAVAHEPALVHPDDYTFTQLVGVRLHREGHPGLVTRSARCAGDTYAVLNPGILSNPRPYCYLTYTTTATGVAVERTPGTLWLHV